MLEFLAAFAAVVGVVAPVVKNLGDIAQGGRQMLGFADQIFARFARNRPGEQVPADLRVALAEVAAIPQAEFDRKVEEIVDVELVDKPPEYRSRVAEYIKLVKPRVNSTFSRRDDPAGTTVPARWSTSRAEDLVPFLPPRPPMFTKGDKPPEASGWTLSDRIGIGGFGEVWKARSKWLQDTESAFKFCLDPISQKRILEWELKNIQLVQNELRNQPHIVKLIDAHLDGETPWLRYEYIPGGTLGKLVDTWPDQLAPRAALAVRDIGVLASTLGYCHTKLSKAVIHRDMKFDNVLVDEDGLLKITDFGIGNTQAHKAIEDARLVSATGGAMGSDHSWINGALTPMYASPQQFLGDDPHPADDVYALGVMLYQMLLKNLNLPLGVDMWDDLEEKDVCKELRNVLSRSVASRVERRYQTGAEFAEALAGLPQNLVVEKVVVSVVDQRKQLYDEIDRLNEDAKVKNETARQQVLERKYGEAVATLDSIFHPVMRDPELYARADQFHKGKRFINALGMEFALVPAGTFWMGGQDGNCGDKQVTIDQDFSIGVYPVTQEEWQKVMGTNPSWSRKGGGGADKLSGVSDADLKRFPVENVSWNDCQVFLKKLNESLKETGFLYRLPREAEWEYACRGAAETQDLCGWNFYFKTPTNILSAQQANFAESALSRTTKVGSYQPNTLGLFDMHGNVWELCEDAYDDSNRVFRGGSWTNSAENCRAAFQGWSTPTNSDYNLGLRLARVSSGK